MNLEPEAIEALKALQRVLKKEGVCWTQITVVLISNYE